MKAIIILTILFCNISFGQIKTENLIKSNFKKGLPKQIPFKFSKASYAKIDDSKFFNRIFIICKDTTDFMNNLFFSNINFDKSFDFYPIKFDSVDKNVYKSIINLKTISGDILQPLYVYLTPPKFIQYNWKESSGGTSTSPSIAKEYQLKVGMKFPNLKLETKNGFITTDDFKGKILLINWWATSCLPCREEIPGLNNLVDKYNKKDVVFLSIVSDRNNLDKFLSKYQFKFLHSYGNEHVLNVFEGIYPRNIIVDKRGIIIYNKTGATKDKYKVLDKILKKYLN